LAEGADLIAGYASVHRDEARWTRRVGEVRINAATGYRGAGLGRALAAEIFEVARSLGLKKMAAMMTQDQTGARTAFERLGFTVEAMLTDWVEDRRGHPRDLIVMSYDVAGFTHQATTSPAQSDTRRV
jgi:L-amino acid N-acyltransferase YncA